MLVVGKRCSPKSVSRHRFNCNDTLRCPKRSAELLISVFSDSIAFRQFNRGDCDLYNSASNSFRQKCAKTLESVSSKTTEHAEPNKTKNVNPATPLQLDNRLMLARRVQMPDRSGQIHRPKTKDQTPISLFAYSPICHALVMG